MPPGWVPSSLWTSKKPFTSSSTSSKRRVLCPEAASKVLPCIGSVTHATVAPDAVTFSTSSGSLSRISTAPIRTMNVSRPGSRSGSRRSMVLLERLLGRRGRAELDADRVADPRGELDVRVVHLPGALLANPAIDVRRHVVQLPVRESTRVSADS
ncbi:hypothetical protein SGLAM104S_06665 [Streptomyces glaucescens]